MALKYETQIECGGNQVTITVHDDGALELDGYDEAYDQAAQEFGYEASVCGYLAALWRCESLTKTKITAIFDIIPTVDMSVCLATETVQYAMSLLPDYDDMSLGEIEDLKHNAEDTLNHITEILNERRFPTGDKLSNSTNETTLRQKEHVFLDFSYTYKRFLEKLRSDNEISQRQSATNFFNAVGMLCRSTSEIDRIITYPTFKRIGRYIDTGWSKYIVENAADAVEKAIWSIAFSQNKRTFSDYEETVLWFIGRFVKFMNEQEQP